MFSRRRRCFSQMSMSDDGYEFVGTSHLQYWGIGHMVPPDQCMIERGQGRGKAWRRRSWCRYVVHVDNHREAHRPCTPGFNSYGEVAIRTKHVDEVDQMLSQPCLCDCQAPISRGLCCQLRGWVVARHLLQWLGVIWHEGCHECERWL